MKRVGDPIEIGDTLGVGIEPHELWGRLVAIRKDDCRELERYIIREFTDEDKALGRPYPTGGYRTTAHVWLQPHYQ